MKMKARTRNDSIFFHIPSSVSDSFYLGENVLIFVHDKYVVGKVIKNSGRLYVRVPRSFSTLIKEGEEYEIKKIT